jgi:ABC-type spermidine/putrescine transport system permease subunit I
MINSSLTQPLPPASGHNCEPLRNQQRNENIGLFGLSMPGLLVLVLALVLPITIMTILSFIGADGSLGLENYLRIWKSSVYGKIFSVTFTVAFLTTVIVILIGYPLAYFLSQLSRRAANLAMLGVLMPFWTAVLVRTYAWIVLLQSKGIINSTLINFGVIDEPLALANNLTGTLIGMVHVMLPFLVLPLYSSMKAVDPDLMSAASNLGATPTRAFLEYIFPAITARPSLRRAYGVCALSRLLCYSCRTRRRTGNHGRHVDRCKRSDLLELGCGEFIGRRTHSDDGNLVIACELDTKT